MNSFDRWLIAFIVVFCVAFIGLCKWIAILIANAP